MSLYILGIMGTMQVVFVPGYLVCSIWKIKGLLRVIIYAFALSLIINCLIVFFATLAGCYNRYLVYGMFAAEIFGIVYIKWRNVGTKTGDIFLNLTRGFKTTRESLSENIRNVAGADEKGRMVYRFFVIVGFVSAVASVLFLSYYFYFNMGTVFFDTDAIVSYNRWAVDWYNAMLPRWTWTYPQLIPSNWSMIYMFMGNSEIQFFAKAIMPLFGLCTLFVFIDLAVRIKEGMIFWAVPFFTVLIQRIYGFFLITAGMTDIPLIFFTTISVSLLLVAHYDSSLSKKELINNIILGAVFAAGAALTKQTGVYYVIVFTVLVYILAMKERTEITTKRKVLYIGMLMTIIAIIIGPWYIYKFFQIMSGVENHVLGAYAQYPQPSSLAGKVQLIVKTIGITNCVILLLFMLISLRERASRWLLFMMLPLIVFWGYYLSYDLRNLTIIIPICSLTASIGFKELLVRLTHTKVYEKVTVIVKRLPAVFIFVIAVACIFVPGLFHSNEKLVNRQHEQLMFIGYPDVNREIKNYHEKNKLTGMILTNYMFLSYLPGMKGHVTFDHFNTYELYKEKIKEMKISYVLIINPDLYLYDKRIPQEINNAILHGNGGYELLRQGKGANYSFKYVKVLGR